MTLSTNDLVFSQATQKLYASVPSSEGSTGNSVAEIDPVSATVTNQTFVGSEPAQLAQADDGATLYVGLDGAASIRSYNILNHTAGAQFVIGRDNSTWSIWIQRHCRDSRQSIGYRRGTNEAERFAGGSGGSDI